MTFRIVTEPGARVAGLRTGELQGVEDVPTKSVDDLKKDKNIKLLPLKNWWIQIATPNTGAPPTDNLMFRKAVQAALNMDEIMQAASDGNYSLNVGFQYPNQPDYTDAGKDTYNLHDPALAKKYLAQSGYKNEPVVLLTDKDYPPMYNSALVMAEQLKAVGINAQLKVDGLADLGADLQQRQHRLELLLHRLGHAAGAGCARHHGVLRAADPGLPAAGQQGRPRIAEAVERHEHAADRPGARQRRSPRCRNTCWTRSMRCRSGR